jgi:SAM-dependent methyltransferase
MDDFYTDRLGLAGYFEKEWFDHVVAQRALPPSFFEFAAFDSTFLYDDTHEKVAAFLSQALNHLTAAPERLLEIGTALGRGFYEVCQRVPSLRSATLVEPSQLFAQTFESLFRGHVVSEYPVLRGNAEIVNVPFDSARVRQAVQHVDFSLLNTSHEGLGHVGVFDLVMCLNVIDNAEAPLALVDRLKQHTAPGGVLILSTTYAWSTKYLGTAAQRATGIIEPVAEPPTRNILSLFGAGWTLLGETNIEFKVRRTERYWRTFLSHVAVFQNAQ